MTTSALIMMLSWTGFVSIMTIYFFYKVLTKKKKPEPDSYSENDG
jgi:heme/copper-type cytochrome/quinol oxidase subunit 2